MLGIVGLPIPDETLLVLVGYLVMKGTLQAVPAFATALAGTIGGITVSYLLGRTGGVHLIRRYGTKLHITGNNVTLVRRWFDRIGKWTLLIGYFIPGLRHVIAIVAGASGLQTRSFAIFAYSGAFIWSSIFISIGYIVGREWRVLMEAIRGLQLTVVLIMAIAGVLYILLLKRMSRKHSR